jgi:glycosyltransferase involved in cell wall biosynthesis
MSRRLLVVAYFFPPLGGIGVQRTLKYVRYLAEHGWSSVVVAPRGAVYRVMDPALAGELPTGIEVHRAFCYEPARLRQDLRRAARGLTPERGDGKGREGNGRDGAMAGHGFPRRMLEAAWRAWVWGAFVPDEQMGWVPFAVRAGITAHRRPVDAIYSSSPPASGHLAAGLIKGLIRRPWIADFRDPWVGNTFAPRTSRLRARLEAWMERWVIRHADRVIFATPSLTVSYARRYPQRRHRFVTIPNGYDPADLPRHDASAERAPSARPSNDAGARRFRLVYAGSVYGELELRLFVQGLTEALRRRPDLVERLRVEFVGWMTEPNRRLLASASDAVRDVVDVLGFRPRAEALKRLATADAALIILGNDWEKGTFVPAKLYEAIGLDLPVLAIVPPGDARTVLAELGWGTVVDPEPTAIAAALERLPEQPQPEGRADPEGRFERGRLAARLAALLDELVAQPPPR